MKKLGKAPKAKVSFEPEPELSAPVPSGPPQLLVGQGGKFFEFPGSSVETALASGFRLPTPEELTERDNAAKYGDRPGTAALLGGARGLTLGASDLLAHGAEKIGVLPTGTTEAMHQIKERNPGASLAGEIASFAVPAIAPLKALGAAQAGLGAAGSAVGKTAAKIVGERLGVLAAPAAKMASEAAMFQVAHNLSEAALKDEELTAENITANIGHAATIGGGLGFALPVFGGLASKVIDKGVDTAVKQTAKFFDPDRSLRLYSGAMGNGALVEDTIKGNKFKDAVSWLRKKGFYGDGEVVSDSLGGFKQVKKGSMPSSEKAYERLLTSKQDIINTRARVLEEADNFASVHTQLREKLAQFPPQAEAEIRKSIADAASNGVVRNVDELNATLAWGKGLFEQKGGSLAGLEELKEGLYERIGKGYETIGDAEMRVLKDLARTVKSQIETGVEIARKSDPQLAKSLASVGELNKTLSALETIRRPLDKLRKKAEANVNLFGMRWRDLLAGVGGAQVFGPVGALLGVASKALQTEQGLLWRARLGEQISAMGWANGLNQKTTDKISKSLGAFLSKTSKASELAVSDAIASTPAQRRIASQGWFADTQKQIMQSIENPDAIQDKLEKQMGGFKMYAPGVADALVSKQMQILGYLADRMPKDPTMSLNPFKSDWEPSDQEVYRFKQLVRTAREPMSILEDFEKGTLSREQVQAVQDLYPKIYGQIVEQATQMAATKTMPYQKRVQLSTLLGVPMDNTMRPQFIQRMQQLSQQQQEPLKGSSKQPGFAKRAQSASDRVATR